MTTIEELRGIPWFSDLPENRLDWLASEAKPKELKAGDFLLRQGEAAGSFHVLISGSIILLQSSGTNESMVGMRKAPCFLGEIAVLTGKPVTVSCRAVDDSKLLWWNDDAFFELLGSCRQFARSMFSAMTERISENESISREMEKMASLGTLAAGLAHELNNPAAAAVRSLSRAEERAADIIDLAQSVSGNKKNIDVISHLITSFDKDASPQIHDALSHADAEDEFADWLDQKGVDGAWDLAPVFAQAGITLDGLQNICADIEDIDASKILQWVGAVMELRSLLGDSRNACGRISDLVKAMKSYSYMDQDITQEVNIHQGIDDTLTILKHKMPASVEVRRHYATDLPKITVYGSELNQVWTNILDNALDALQNGGVINIGTRSEGENVIITITDDGPGIPADIQRKIFDPFFTTKSVGQGTGLGLNLSHRIVVARHCGSLSVMSKPGETQFTISLPVNPPGCSLEAAEALED